MSFNLCPACEHANPADAKFCNACGLRLVVTCPHCDAPNRPGLRACAECGERLKTGKPRRAKAPTDPGDAPAGEQITLVLTEEPQRGRPAGARSDPSPAPLADPPDAGDAFTLTLRGVEAALPKAVAGPLPQLRPRPKPPPEAPAQGLILSDPGFEPPSPSDVFGRPDATNGTDAGLPPAARSKVARRATVRRRITNASRPADTPFEPTDLLVLDPDDAANAQLSRMLIAFGFRVHSAYDVVRADELIGAHALAAAFLVVELDGSPDGAASALCQRVKPARPAAGRVTALIIVAEHARPVVRVRATMIGADAFLTKPLKRGDVVRALEDCGIALPLDARRSY